MNKIIIMLLLLPLAAAADGVKQTVDSYNTVTTTKDESINNNSDASVVINIDNAGSGSADSAGVQSTGSGGDSVSTSNESNLFALSLGFPNAVGCFGGIEGGGSGGGVGGFLGFHKLNVACWMNQLAESERSLAIRARLKCGDKHFRNAMTYDMKGNKFEETQACIDFVTPEWLKEIAAEKAVARSALGQCGSPNDVCSFVNGELRHEVTD